MVPPTPYPSLRKTKVLAVPGGRWRIGSPVVSTYIGGEVGYWVDLPVRNCVICNVPNSWPTCWECGGTIPLPFKLCDGTVVTEIIVELVTHLRSSEKTHKWLHGEVSVFAIDLIRSDPDLWGKHSDYLNPRKCHSCGVVFQPSRMGHLRRYCSNLCAKPKRRSSRR